MSTRAIIVGAPRSGSGKTSVTIGLLRALARRGLRVRGAKSGPDYIDPGFHAAATGLPGVNLDSWAMPPALIDRLLADAAADADILVIESAMGLFDGIPSDPGRSGAAADIARRHGLPVLLVLDVSGQSQTAAAIAKGFAVYDPAVRIAGVVLNRLGSERHRKLAGDAIAAIGLPVVGGILRDPNLTLPERHLGLVQAEEHADLAAHLDRLADAMERSLEIDALLALAEPLQLSGIKDRPPLRFASQTTSPPIDGGEEGRFTISHPAAIDVASQGSAVAGGISSPPSIGGEVVCKANRSGGRSLVSAQIIALPPPGQRIALARDAAFTFLYPHLAAAWHAAGAEIVPFSPLADDPPPADCDVCWLPGGYPELHAGALAAAQNFKTGLLAFAAQKPVHGECGGFMVLGEALEDASGSSHEMLGLLGHSTSFAQRKMNLGYRQARLRAASPLGLAGTMLRGHEFHYARVTAPGNDEPLADLFDGQGNALGPSGARRGLVTGTFFHAIALEG